MSAEILKRGNFSERQVELGDLPIKALLAFHQGWVDAQSGIWPRAYEVMPEVEQSLYEQGRLAVLNVALVGSVPIWRGDRHTASGPVKRSLMRSIALTGSPFP